MAKQCSSKFASKDEIIVFWYPTLQKEKGIKSISMIVGKCFACLTTVKHLDRAHITPHMDGGGYDASNLHLLCKICHKESELLSGEDYMTWFCGMSHTKRMAIEYVKYHIGEEVDRFVRKFSKDPHHQTAMDESFYRTQSRRDKEIQNQRSSENLGRPSKMSPLVIQEVHQYRSQGVGIKEIAKRCGIGIGSVYKAMDTIPKPIPITSPTPNPTIEAFIS